MFGTSLPEGTLKDIEKEVGGLLHVSMERSLKFDIFSGTVDKNAFLLEHMEGLENVKRRMEGLATKWPERHYSVFLTFPARSKLRSTGHPKCHPKKKHFPSPVIWRHDSADKEVSCFHVG